MVMFIHREEYLDSEDERAAAAGQAELIVAKQRNGPTGDVKLFWFKDFTRFRSADTGPTTSSSSSTRPTRFRGV